MTFGQDIIPDSIRLYMYGADGTQKWHPNAIYVVYPEMKLIFYLPYENDLSGVANLLFQKKETGEIHLLDSVINGRRYFEKFPTGQYDAILLYNNGKYIRCGDITFDENIEIEKDLEGLSIQPANTESIAWLSLRSFNTPVSERVSYKNYTPASEIRITGYVLREEEPEVITTTSNTGSVISKNSDKKTTCSKDGYFEIDADDDPCQFLQFAAVGHDPIIIQIAANSGIFLVLKKTDLSNVKFK